ncbi:DUF4942 domain-containing protein [Brucella gallinifaecis]|uniref:DUF4942 domain-containing protein n=1 Tax=Brucella gallinifaecis TaxID=215590 RepID=A0A502BU67_9HYPH|nr:DUF4942 domain-containing protein [Brucella gallinifaecis]TPF76716.1 DUF4942 domain-containing protein [Brucella gallinifaecis]
MNEISLGRRLSDVVAEYEHKKAAIPDVLETFNKAGTALKMACSIAGTHGRENINTGHVHSSTMEQNLLKSSWFFVYDKLQISYLASANDKRRFEQSMASPPEFTIDNLRATFGDYLLDPRGNILRGLAEVFCELDQAYKSHDKVKIGVKGLPKRVILSNVGGYGSYGRDRLINLLNALAAYQGKALVEYDELKPVDNYYSYVKGHSVGEVKIEGRGVSVRKFMNGNAHVIFDEQALRDINMALAEYYGDVLPDVSEDKPEKRQESTAVAKDLQYYPTPQAVVDRVVGAIYGLEGQRILEPSCGCGRFMDALRSAGADVVGCEIDPVRVSMCQAKGHRVMRMNFLETVPKPEFDRVIMNPPFYGTHYAKHVNHALRFLKPGGTLTAILPVTARYDHGLLDGRWDDLPVGSFRESGTNINTTILTMRAAA